MARLVFSNEKAGHVVVCIQLLGLLFTVGHWSEKLLALFTNATQPRSILAFVRSLSVLVNVCADYIFYSFKLKSYITFFSETSLDENHYENAIEFRVWKYSENR